MVGDNCGGSSPVALFYRAAPVCQALTDFNAEAQRAQRRGEERKRLNAKAQRGKGAKGSILTRRRRERRGAEKREKDFALKFSSVFSAVNSLLLAGGLGRMRDRIGR
jgi:hypothetical protein